MGLVYSIYNYLGFGHQYRTNDPDPVTGLTSKDKYLITNSWAVVRKTPTESGVALFNVLFKNHPELLSLFPFKDIPIKELPSNKRFQAHANAVIYGFSAIVDSLNETDLLVTILTKVGESHVPRKVGEKEFIDLKGSVIELFSTLFTGEEIASWRKALEVSFDVMIKANKETSKS